VPLPSGLAGFVHLSVAVGKNMPVFAFKLDL
jgi:hypothetical protein